MSNLDFLPAQLRRGWLGAVLSKPHASFTLGWGEDLFMGKRSFSKGRPRQQQDTCVIRLILFMSQGMVGGTDCPQSFYCPEGSSAPKLCPAGTHSSTKNLQAASTCTPCPEGKYCGDDGLELPSGDCQAGFFCKGGSASSAPQVNTVRYK